MPSVDRVGRYFPLIIAVALGDAGAPGAAAGEAWFSAAEDCAIQVLDPARTVDDFEASLARLYRDPVPSDTAVTGNTELPSSDAAVTEGAQLPSSDAAVTEGAQLPSSDTTVTEGAGLPWDTAATEDPGLPSSGESLWWDRDTVALRCEGLPTPQQFVALFAARAS